MSNALLVSSAGFSVLFVVMLALSAEPQPHNAADVLQAEGRITAAQANLVRQGASVEEAMSIPDDCADRCTFNIAREFPLVCDCPGSP
jgi:hypothetical protein